jgi:pimeloyl-ACP methyl ester carboxylesterase
MNTWILLRGLTREQRHWHEFPRLLEMALPGDRVITLELPGNGELNALTSPSRIEGMATYGRLELARLGVAPPYHLLAMSMGAMVATAWADSHPEEIAALVMINTSFGAFSPVHQRFRPRAWRALLRLLLTRSLSSRDQIIFDLTSRLVAPSAPVVEAWTTIRRTRPVLLSNALRQLFAAARYRAPYHPPVEILILASAGDRLVDPRCSMEIARRWNCTIALHPTAGHDLPLDDGAWVVEHVQDWLKDVTTSRRERSDCGLDRQC